MQCLCQLCWLCLNCFTCYSIDVEAKEACVRRDAWGWSILFVKSKKCFLVKSPFFLVHPAFWVGDKSPFLMIIWAMVTTWYMGYCHPCGHPSHIENPCDGYMNPFEQMWTWIHGQSLLLLENNNCFDRQLADQIHCLILHAQVAEVRGWNLQKSAHSRSELKLINSHVFFSSWRPYTSEIS